MPDKDIDQALKSLNLGTSRTSDEEREKSRQAKEVLAQEAETVQEPESEPESQKVDTSQPAEEPDEKVEVRSEESEEKPEAPQKTTRLEQFIAERTRPEPADSTREMQQLRERLAAAEAELRVRSEQMKSQAVTKPSEPEEPSFEISPAIVRVLAQEAGVDEEQASVLLRGFDEVAKMRTESEVKRQVGPLQKALQEYDQRSKQQQIMAKLDQNILQGVRQAAGTAGKGSWEQELLADYSSRGRDSIIHQYIAQRSPYAALTPEGVVQATHAYARWIESESGKSNGRVSASSLGAGSESSAAGGGGGSELRSTQLSTKEEKPSVDDQVRDAIRKAGRPADKLGGLFS